MPQYRPGVVMINQERITPEAFHVKGIKVGLQKTGGAWQTVELSSVLVDAL